VSHFGRLVRELQRRRVFRIAAGYVVAAWLLLQVTDLAFASLELPGRALSYVWFALLVGFPVALVFGWRYDFTVDGIARTPPADADESVDLSLRRPDYAILVALAVVIAAISYGLITQVGEIDPEHTESARPDAPPNSLAVLPFVNMSSDPEQEYFSDGLSEELLNGLAQVKGLRVAGRTSSFHFKGVNTDLRDIGEKLGVGLLLEGSVRKAGNRIRVTAQLINAADGFHLWSDTYDYELEDLFRIQDEISFAVVNAMQVTLLGEDRAQLSNRRPVSFEAQKLYLEGRQLLHEQTMEAAHQARSLFEKAIDIDPAYGLAYSGLADAILDLSAGGEIVLEDALYQSRPFIERALAFDDKSAEIWTSLGRIELNARNWSAASDALEQAIALNPSHAEAYLRYSVVLEPERAIEVLEKVLVLDPLNRDARTGIANRLKNLGRIEEAIVQAEKAIVLDPEYDHMYQVLFNLHTNYTFRHDEALYWVQRAHEIWPDEVVHMMSIVFVYMTLGMDEEAERWAAYVQEKAPDHMFVRGLPMIIALYRQDADQALAEIDKLEAAGVLRHNPLIRRIVGQMLVWTYILADQTGKGLAFLQEFYPQIFGNEPEVLGWASNLAAYMLARDGEREKATPILAALREHIEKQGLTEPRLHKARAHIALWENDYQGFVDSMNRAVNAGWLLVFDNYWSLDRYPPTRRWIGRPEFDALVERIAAGIAEQRANVEERLREEGMADKN